MASKRYFVNCMCLLSTLLLTSHLIVINIGFNKTRYVIKSLKYSINTVDFVKYCAETR